MRFHVNAIFALQTRQGLVFGCARDIEGDHLVFQVPGSLSLGEVLDWRMQLVGRPEMVLGALRVESQRPGPPGEHPIFDGRIIVMTEQNRALMQTWLVERSGSTSRESSQIVDSLAAVRGAPKLGSSVRKAGRYRLRGGDSAGGGTPSGKQTEPPGGREAITAAILKSLSRTMRQPVPQQRPVAAPPPRVGAATGAPRLESIPRLEPTPPPSRPRLEAPPPRPEMALPPELRPAPGRLAPGQPPITQVVLPPQAGASAAYLSPRKMAPPIPPPPPAEAPRPSPASEAQAGQAFRRGTDPVVAIKVGSRPVQVLVRYRTWPVFRRDYEQHIRGSGLLLAISELEDLQTRGTMALVRIDLPSGANVVCRAEVVAPMVTGTGFQLHLSEEQHRVLAMATRA